MIQFFHSKRWWDVKDARGKEQNDRGLQDPQNKSNQQEWQDNIAMENKGNLQVSRKQDTYFGEIKEDLSKCYCFSLKARFLSLRKKQNIYWENFRMK